MQNFQVIGTNNKRTRWGSFIFLCALLIFVDQVSKYGAASVYKNSNFGFSLSMPTGLMFGIYFFVLGLIIIYFIKNFFKFSWQTFIAWTWIVSGAISNVGERILLGFVRDWVYIANGVFNLADVYILLGVGILLAGYKKTDY